LRDKKSTLRVEQSTLLDSFFFQNYETKRWPFLTYSTSVWGLHWKSADILASKNWTPWAIVTRILRDPMFRGVVTLSAYDGQTDTQRQHIPSKTTYTELACRRAVMIMSRL